MPPLLFFVIYAATATSIAGSGFCNHTLAPRPPVAAWTLKCAIFCEWHDIKNFFSEVWRCAGWNVNSLLG